jgi:hypothetical protein
MEVSAEAVGRLQLVALGVPTEAEESPQPREVEVEVDPAAVLLSACCIGDLAVPQDLHHQSAQLLESTSAAAVEVV